ncbi:TM0106 family RecB-like putative nuclease [Synechococcus sp. RSCCF101]|uniref:TM0106 family RecB-like putative nuclease n=1 Tax=Synechococcus sp. RSCCF101 TaxID=2511069 RepID=UPI00351A46EC
MLARQGRRLTREHRLLLALWARLLEPWQGGAVPFGAVLARAGQRPVEERVRLGSGWQRQLDGALENLAAALERDQPAAIVDDRRKCTLCSWHGLCGEEAARAGHLGDVSGIGGKRRQMLQDLGIDRLEQLAEQDPEDLARQLGEHGDQHRDVAPMLVQQARVQRRGQPRRLADGPALPELEDAAGVLLYDIESDPDRREDFLHGFLRLPRSPDGRWCPEAASYHPLLLRADLGEDRHWRRLEGFLDRYGTWPILHYGETEAIALQRLARRQGVPPAAEQALRARMIDVHARLRTHWLLPVPSYGLKSVAGWLDFRWRQAGVEGARALLWWRLWNDARAPAAGRRLLLRRILTYNQDDCRATWAVAAWLLQGAAQRAPDPAPTGGSTNPAVLESCSSTAGPEPAP